jgi:hypothetical protein
MSLTSAIQEMGTTYDATVLSDVEQNEEVILKELRNVGNNTLLMLAENYFRNKKPVSRYLSGPRACTKYVKDAKTVYIFGEVHGWSQACVKENSMSIVEYFSRLFKTTDVFIDFYLEYKPAEWLPPYEMFTKGFLNQMRIRFKKCIKSRSRHDKDCRLVRAHYTDIRTRFPDSPFALYAAFGKLWESIVNASWFSGPNDRYSQDAQGAHRLRKHLSKLRKLAEMCKPLLNIITLKAWVKKWYLQATNKEVDRSLPSAKKAIKRWRDDLIKKYINEYGRSIFVNVKVFTELVSEFDSDPTDATLAHEISKVIHDLYNEILHLMAGTLDIYTVSRMFKQFDVERRPGTGRTGFLFWRKPVKHWEQPPEPHNMVVYAGDLHAHHVKAFLQHYMGFKLVEEGKQINERCVDMHNIHQPIFM